MVRASARWGWSNSRKVLTVSGEMPKSGGLVKTSRELPGAGKIDIVRQHSRLESA